MNSIQSIIQEKAKKYGIPKCLVHAIIQVESSGNTHAIRYEPEYRWVYEVELIAKHNRIPESTEENQQMISWGLMQVMGAVAREHGFKGRYISELCTPELGVEYGCKHLKRQYERYNDWEMAIAAYNAGSVRMKGSKYVNQAYVDKVLKNWR